MTYALTRCRKRLILFVFLFINQLTTVVCPRFFSIFSANPSDGDDYLDGGAGNDLLVGGDGTDVLYGDTERFIVTPDAEHGSDNLDGVDKKHLLLGCHWGQKPVEPKREISLTPLFNEFWRVAA